MVFKLVSNTPQRVIGRYEDRISKGYGNAELKGVFLSIARSIDGGQADANRELNSGLFSVTLKAISFFERLNFIQEKFAQNGGVGRAFLRAFHRQVKLWIELKPAENTPLSFSLKDAMRTQFIQTFLPDDPKATIMGANQALDSIISFYAIHSKYCS